MQINNAPLVDPGLTHLLIHSTMIAPVVHGEINVNEVMLSRQSQGTLTLHSPSGSFSVQYPQFSLHRPVVLPLSPPVLCGYQPNNGFNTMTQVMTKLLRATL